MTPINRGVWGGTIGLFAGAFQLFGYTISPTDLREAADLVQGIVVAVAGLIAIYGRVRATKMIG